MDVPEKYNSVDAGIPFTPLKNPKFQKNYKDYTIHKNDIPTNNCYIADIGKKTKYDFQLIAK